MTEVSQSPTILRDDSVDPDWVVEARRNSAWSEAHYDELLRQYDGQWLAVANQQLVAHSFDPGDIRQQVQEFDPTRVLCYFLSSDTISFAPGAIFID